MRLRRAGKHRESEDAINRKSACSTNYKKNNNREYQQVKLKSLAFLSAGPVHKEAEGKMHRQNCNQHVYTNSKSCDSSQKSENEPNPAEELCRDRQEGQRSR